jgi:antitoxin (DNA-binding transcriptional repressor) of toxin-antitoxin stability system
MTTITLQEAQASLAELIHRLGPGEEAVLTENDQPVARIISTRQRSDRKLGTLRGTVIQMSADFDAPLDDFKEYMQ